MICPMHDRFSPTNQVMVNGHAITISAPSDRAIVARVCAFIDRKIAENDWSPYSTKEAALRSWAKPEGIRKAVLKAKGLI